MEINDCEMLETSGLELPLILILVQDSPCTLTWLHWLHRSNFRFLLWVLNKEGRVSVADFMGRNFPGG